MTPVDAGKSVAAEGSALAPLRHLVFSALWTATVVSNIGIPAPAGPRKGALNHFPHYGDVSLRYQAMQTGARYAPGVTLG